MTKCIEKSRIINCSLSTAWCKWTTHQGLLTFFGVDNQIELKSNGAFEIYFLMDQPKGLRGSEGCKIISFSLEKTLSFTWNAPPSFPEIRNHVHQTQVDIHFKTISDEQTTITLRHHDWLRGDDWDAVYAYFENAWEKVLDWMDASWN